MHILSPILQTKSFRRKRDWLESFERHKVFVSKVFNSHLYSLVRIFCNDKKLVIYFNIGEVCYVPAAILRDGMEFLLGLDDMVQVDFIIIKAKSRRYTIQIIVNTSLINTIVNTDGNIIVRPHTSYD